MTNEYDWVILVEKPDQKRHFENTLSLKDNHTPYLDGSVKLISARGRLYDFEKPEVQNEQKYGREVKKNISSMFSVSNDKKYRSDKDRLDNMPVSLSGQKIKYTAVDNNALRIGHDIAIDLLSANNIIVATDWDTEGELIFNDILDVNDLKKSLNWDHVYRLHLTALDDVSIIESLKNKQAYVDEYASNIPEVRTMLAQGFARSIVDYEFGYTFSFYNEVIKRQLDIQQQGGLGRLKLSVLTAILDRESDVLTQDTRQKYQVKCILSDNTSLVLNDEFVSERDAYKKIASLPSRVTLQTQKSENKSLPPELFDRTSFIIYMSSKISNFDWGRPLQKAYETYYCVSYPRTSSNFISVKQFTELKSLLHNSDVMKLVQEKISDNGYDVNIDELLTKIKPRRKYVTKDISNINSHHAIIPLTSKSINDVLFSKMFTHSDKKVYDAYLEVLFRTIAMFMSNSVDEGQLVKLYSPTHDLIAKQVFLKTKELGWRYLLDNHAYEDSFTSLPDGEVDVKYEVIPSSLELAHNYNYPELLSYLNNNNIGTESTREPVIADLKRLSVICENNNEYTVNETVKKILQVIRHENWLSSIAFQDWDKQISNIKNMAEALKFVSNQRNLLKDLNKEVIKWYISN